MVLVAGAMGSAATGQKVAGTTDWDFSSTEKWSVWWPEQTQGPAPFTTHTDIASGWRLEIEPTPSYLILNTFNRALQKQWLRGVQYIEFKVNLESGPPVNLSASFEDQDGERFYLAPKTLGQGEQTLRWSFPAEVEKRTGDHANGEVDGGIKHRAVYVERLRKHRAVPVKISFTSAKFEQELKPLELISASLDTGDPLHIVRPDQLESAAIKLTNQGPESVVLKGNILVGDTPTGDRRSWVIEVSVPAKGDTLVSIPRDVLAPATAELLGVKYVAWRWTIEGDNEHIEGQASLAVMDPVGVTSGVDPEAFVFGLAGFHSEWSAPRDKLDLITRASAIIGVEAVRFGTAWRHTEPRPGEWNWVPLDRLVDTVTQSGMEPQLMLSFGGADWTKPPESLARARADNAMPRQWRYPPRPELWREFVRQVAQRYKGRVRLWEVWNEPDIGFFRGTTDQYLELLEIAHEELKSVDPDNIVISGGLAAYSHRDAKHDLYERLMTEARPHYDYFGYHRHGTFDRLYNEIENRIIPMRERFDAAHKPFYFNETGLAREFEREREMGSSLAKKLTYVWSRGAAGYHWFCMWVPESKRGSSAYGYRMLNENFTPRPPFVAFNTMARYLRGREYVGDLDLGEGRFGFLFRGEGHFEGDNASDYAAIVWTERSGLSPIVLAMDAGGAQQVQQVTLNGTVEDATMLNRYAVVEVGSEPSLLLFDGASINPPGLVEPLLELPAAVAIAPGQPTELELSLSNPSDQKLPINLGWHTGSGIEVLGPSDSVVSLKPGETQRIRQSVALPHDATPGGRAPDLSLQWQVSDAVVAYTTPITVSTALAITTEDMANRPPDVTLSDAVDIVNNNDIDPDTLRFTWGGADDLSAVAWFVHDSTTLRVRIAVRDDIHRQTHRGKTMFRGDSLQLAIAIPSRSGTWEFGFALDEAGEPLRHTWSRIENIGLGNPVRAFAGERQGTQTLYDISLDIAKVGADPSANWPLSLSFVVNDDDEDRREGYLQLTPGIAGGKDTSQFLPVVFR